MSYTNDCIKSPAIQIALFRQKISLLLYRISHNLRILCGDITSLRCLIIIRKNVSPNSLQRTTVH